MPSHAAAASSFKNVLQAVGLVFAGYSFFAVNDALTKWLIRSYPLSEVIFISGGCGAAIIAALILFKYGWRGFLSPNTHWHLTRGVCIALSTFCVVHALSLIPLADFYSIVFLSPLAMAVMSHFFLNERIGWHRFIAIIAGFCGILVLAGPQFENPNPGFLFALVSVLFVSGNGIFARLVRHENNKLLYAFYPMAGNALFNLPLTLPDFQTPAAADIPLMALLVVFGICGILCYTMGFARAPETALVAPIHYTQILWGVAFGYVLFGDVPSLNTLAGATIIIGAGLYLLWREHINHRNKAGG